MKWTVSCLAVLLIWIGSAAHGASIVGTYDGTFVNTTSSRLGSFTMTITKQTPNGIGFDLEGYTDVLCPFLISCHGRLIWEGSLLPSGAIEFEDTDVIANEFGDPLGVAEASYTGAVSGDTISGDWTFLRSAGRGTFSVVAVPEPGTLPAIALGIASLTLRRHSSSIRWPRRGR